MQLIVQSSSVRLVNVEEMFKWIKDVSVSGFFEAISEFNLGAIAYLLNSVLLCLHNRKNQIIQFSNIIMITL